MCRGRASSLKWPRGEGGRDGSEKDGKGGLQVVSQTLEYFKACKT